MDTLKVYIRFFTLFVMGLFFRVTSVCNAQEVLGTSGLMNIPTADMYKPGTFKGGVSFVQRKLHSDVYDYNTGIYYIDFTPFPFVELTFRETLLKVSKGGRNEGKKGFYQQDRSTSLRLRPVKEKNNRWWPGVVIGVNDIYSDHGGSRYTSVYGVATKHFDVCRFGRLGLTCGYAAPFDDGVAYDGIFGGMAYSPDFFKDMSVVIEYDTRGTNIGISAKLFRCLNVMCFTREFEGVNAGLSYMYTIKY
ncbi:YjbH domain-containing protein [Xylanibacter muris]|nr:YjbH domain-containing protein [Xylanibacter muris]